MDQSIKNLLEKPRESKLERAINALKMLPYPMFPEEKDSNNEVLKVMKAARCHRATVYNAVNELKLRHLIKHYSINIEDKKFDRLKNVTLRSVNRELLDHLSYIYNILKGILSTGVIPMFKGHDKSRLGLIEKYLGEGVEDSE